MLHRVFFIVLALTSLKLYSQENSKLEYPPAPLSDVADNYFGTIVQDPYRKLEDDSLPETKKWLKEENKLSEKYLNKLLDKYPVQNQLMYNDDFYDWGVVDKSGKYFFELRGQTLCVKKRAKSNAPFGIVNLPEYSHGLNDVVSLRGYAVSKDNNFLAFSLSHSGSDWQEIRLVSLYPCLKHRDVIKGAKFTNIEWKGKGFFYCTYEKPEKGKELTELTTNAKIYYHKLGDRQEEDTLVYKSEYEIADIDFEVTADERFLIIYSEKKRGEELFKEACYFDFKSKTQKKEFKTFISIPSSQKCYFDVVDDINGKFLVQTDIETSRGRLLIFDPAGLNKTKVFIPEYAQVLVESYHIGDKIIAIYINELDYHCITFDESGKVVNNIAYPTGSSAGGFDGTSQDSTIVFYYESFLHPPVPYEYNVHNLKVKLVEETEVPYDIRDFEIIKEFYTSKDGKKIPMFIAKKKGLPKNGNAPTVLYGYGGYGIIETPFFDRGFMNHIENDGIVALACLRGGGEYGKEWHEEGSMMNKQNVFDDFIAAAEFLFEEHYTNPNKLALMGGSNGGLLVGAVIAQRPDICKVAIAEVGVYDMLRYQNFTIGYAWSEEFGTSDDSLQFKYLYKYSPLHNLKNNVKYPATLVITGDHDDRAVPLHSYKFAAALQQSNNGNNPILLYVQKNTGHSVGSTKTQAMIYSFIYENMGIKRKKIYGAY